jgi:eukaryotic-like serine/threonine-protein kinase
MGLGIGTRLGSLEIVAPLGAGGMGEVYRARDARLQRDVALKILPASLAHDNHLLVRLEREARTLAALNHPNIAAIYGLEEAEGQRALVMELVEGETLAEHLRRPAANALSAEETLPIAKQIAEALEYAHERGVIHRDLKPANVKITPEGAVKVLDFGLAKVVSDQDSARPAISADSPTLSAMATRAGIILGTAPYMAPEQAKGKQVDRRADIWAFGCVLYEMLAQKKAFEGETTSDVLAAVIRGEPDWTALPATTPPAMRRLIRRCLQKDVRQRLQAIGDARIALEEILSGPGVDAETSIGVAPQAKRASLLHRTLPWALGGVAVISACISGWLLFKPAPRPNVVRFPLFPAGNTGFVLGGEASISPDGRMLAFVARAQPAKLQSLWLRSLDSMTVVPIPGTDGAFYPFWSPDSRQLGFEAGGKLEKLAVAGGTPQTLCDVNGFWGGAWNRDGVIVFANGANAAGLYRVSGTSGSSLYRVPDTGGAPTLLLAPDASRHEVGLGFPQFLPDGRHFIFQVATNGLSANLVEAASLDSKAVERLTEADAEAFFALPGYLVYTVHGTLVARPFNANALRFTGTALPVAQNIGETPYASYAFFSVSSAGDLAYQDVPFTGRSQITWFNRAGEKLGTVGPTGNYTAPALSPDGTRFAVAVGDYGKRDIWIYDLKRGTTSRLTFGPADNTNTTWSPDGTRVLFSSNQSGQFEIYQRTANGLGGTQPFFQSAQQNKHLDDLSPDGRYAIYDTAGGGSELWGLPLFGDRKPFAFVQGSFLAASAAFSPNSRYVAYASEESGDYEVYVQTFPQQTGKWQISTAGGTQPEWNHNGKELFYLARDGKLMAVGVNTNGATFQPGIPKPLFQTQLDPSYRGRNFYVVSPDGQRFLLLTPAEDAGPEPITVVVNWPALLERGGNK